MNEMIKLLIMENPYAIVWRVDRIRDGPPIIATMKYIAGIFVFIGI